MTIAASFFCRALVICISISISISIFITQLHSFTFSSLFFPQNISCNITQVPHPQYDSILFFTTPTTIHSVRGTRVRPYREPLEEKQSRGTCGHRVQEQWQWVRMKAASISISPSISISLTVSTSPAIYLCGAGGGGATAAAAEFIWRLK